ncbi:hypothetical protein KP733_08940 [Streptococcus equi subsp. zooepidemicus]|uniref:hypothetical protein n=1 Tax=Streptococcus equi TaxID=1336 RepID=UPI001E3CB2AD|nr:hypothetical protein [Streptococcus equi]MCD3387510.1 hypothetical protein [Streptococcus equi subsp. zooepidemicus]
MSLQAVNQTIEENPIKGKDERKTKRRKIKKVLRKVTDEFSVSALKKYETHQETFEGRNSFSKTDTDATFMRRKEDHVKNGQLKAGYNLQLATEKTNLFFTMMSSNQADTKTLLPFFEIIHMT